MRERLLPFLTDAFSVVEETTRLQSSWYLGAVAEHAEAIVKGQLPRLVVRQPPGTLKSLTWCVFFPAWTWIRFPQMRFLIGTNEQKNASRDATYCRKLIQSRWYQDSFNPTWKLADDQDQKLFYQTTRGGHRLCVTTGGSTAGKKGHVLLVDDIHDAKEVHSKTKRDSDKDWFRLGFSDRMMNFRTSAIAVIGHALHVEALDSELIREGWPLLNLPERFEDRLRKTFPVQVEYAGRRIQSDPRAEGEWLRPSRFGEKEMASVVANSGALSYAAKHEQEPKVRGGLMFDYDRPRRVPTYPVGTVAVRYWDTAASESESACNSSGVLIGKTPEGRYIIIDVERGRWNPAVRNQIMRNRGLEDMRRQGLVFRRLYWEKGTSDSGVERDQLLARALAGIPCAADPARGPKVVRAEPLSSQWEAGNVDIVEGDWNHEYLRRMSEFPLAADKDDADATAGGFNRLALSGDDGELYATATAEETVVGQLPKGTFDTHTQSDPYE